MSNKCINCGEPGTHKHHVVPRSLGGNDTTNCVWLCDNCHGLIHSVSYSDGTISHSELTKIGIETARRNGKQIGLAKGTKLKVKKEAPAKEAIRRYSRDFDGTLDDAATMKLAGVSHATYYKYKREIRQDFKEEQYFG